MTLTAPADGSRTSDTTPAYSGAAGNAAGDSASVTVKVYSGTGTGGTLVQTRTATRSGGTWTVDGSPALGEGTYTAQASQADDAGNTGTSAARTFTVDTTAPAVAIAAPADGARINDATPDITGSGGTGAGDAGTVTLRLYAGATPTGSPLQTGTPAVGGGGGWSFTATTLAEGTYTVQATQTDTAGNSGTSTARTFVVDTTPPAVTLTAPADGSRTSDTTPAYSGAAGSATGDAASVTLKVFAGATATGSPVQTLTATRSGGTWTVDGSPALAEGTYTAQASQADTAGNTGTSAARTFVVDTTAPAVAIAAPADGARINDATPDITGSGGTGAGDAGTVTLRLYAGSSVSGTPLQTGTPAVGGGGGWSFTAAALPEGTYTVQATQSDTAGNSGTSTARTFVVDTTAPGVTLTAPADGSRTSDTTPAYSGAAGNAAGDSASVTVKVYIGTGTGGTLVQTRTATRSGGTWTVDGSPALGEGTYTAQASQADDAGNTGTSAARTFTVDTTAPAVTLAAPADGATFTSGAIAFSGVGGTATGDGSSVTVRVYAGATATGSPVQTLNTTRDGATGAYSVTASPPLPDGQYTAQASQGDVGGNTGASAARTFTVNGPPVVTVTSPPPAQCSATTRRPSAAIAARPRATCRRSRCGSTPARRRRARPCRR